MRCWAFGALVILLLISIPAVAHHAIAAKFDPGKPVSLSGTVVEIDWANPQVHLFIEVKGANAITNWAIELESPIDLQKSGWSRDTLKPGDAVNVQGIAARDGSKQAWANSVVVSSTNKRVFALAAATPRRTNEPAKATPRWPDGQPRLGPLPGERGYWGNPSATSLVQSGANVQVDPDGLLRN